MSTPIETNTEELQEILQTVYNLPMAGGGSSKPDLVLSFSLPSGDWMGKDSVNNDNVTVKSGSAADTYAKLANGEEATVILKCDYYYGPQHYIGTYYPIVVAANTNREGIGAVFMLHTCPDDVYAEYFISIRISKDGTIDKVSSMMEI